MGAAKQKGEGSHEINRLDFATTDQLAGIARRLDMIDPATGLWRFGRTEAQAAADLQLTSGLRSVTAANARSIRRMIVKVDFPEAFAKRRSRGPGKPKSDQAARIAELERQLQAAQEHIAELERQSAAGLGTLQVAQERVALLEASLRAILHHTDGIVLATVAP